MRLGTGAAACVGITSRLEGPDLRPGADLFRWEEQVQCTHGKGLNGEERLDLIAQVLLASPRLWLHQQFAEELAIV